METASHLLRKWHYLAIALWPALLLAQTAAPIKTGLCDLIRNPATYEGKLVEVRAFVDSGVEDLPAGLTDESCAASVKFFTPDDLTFARLIKSKEFRKLTQAVKRNPIVHATITGWFKSVGTPDKPGYGLAIEAVREVTVKPLPRKRSKSDSSLQ